MSKHTIGSAFNIDITQFRKRKSLVEGKAYSGTLKWNTNGNESSILFEANYQDSNNIYLRLNYNLKRNGVWEEIDYRVQIIEIPSNLGKGKLLYFICPVTGNRCRKLYRAYGFDKWISRDAYTALNRRLYYPVQLESYYWKHNTRYHQLDKILFGSNRDKRRKADFYNGTETKRSKQRKRSFDRYCEVGIIKDRLFVEVANRRFPGMFT